MLKFLMLLACPLLLFGKIIESPYFSEILSNADTDTLIFCDVDNTLTPICFDRTLFLIFRDPHSFA